MRKLSDGEKTREIITKAVCGTARKDFRHTHFVDPPNGVVPDQVLGCSVTQLKLADPQFPENKSDSLELEISGNFEVHIWYALNKGKSTDVLRYPIDFKDALPLEDYDQKNTHLLEARTTITKSPKVLDASITDDNRIKIVLELGVYAELVGETKIAVQVHFPEFDLMDD